MFHKHDWKLMAKTYAPPARGITATNLDTDNIAHAVLGVTTLLWECQACHKIRKEEMLGKEEQLKDKE